MLKLSRFLFPLCMLLLTAFVQHAGGARESFYLSSLNNFKASVFTGNGFLKSSQHLIFRPDRSGKEKESALNVAVNVEEKEDEPVSSRKYIQLGRSFHAAFYTQKISRFCHYIRKNTVYFRQFAYSPSNRFLYLRLKVFRI